jgi:hypothetical protein
VLNKSKTCYESLLLYYVVSNFIPSFKNIFNAVKMICLCVLYIVLGMINKWMWYWNDAQEFTHYKFELKPWYKQKMKRICVRQTWTQVSRAKYRPIKQLWYATLLFFKVCPGALVQYNGTEKHVYIANINVSGVELLFKKDLNNYSYFLNLQCRLHRLKIHVSKLSSVQANFTDHDKNMAENLQLSLLRFKLRILKPTS